METLTRQRLSGRSIHRDPALLGMLRIMPASRQGVISMRAAVLIIGDAEQVTPLEEPAPGYS